MNVALVFVVVSLLPSVVYCTHFIPLVSHLLFLQLLDFHLRLVFSCAPYWSHLKPLSAVKMSQLDNPSFVFSHCRCCNKPWPMSILIFTKWIKFLIQVNIFSPINSIVYTLLLEQPKHDKQAVIICPMLLKNVLKKHQWFFFSSFF